jgi:hypothetical protein
MDRMGRIGNAAAPLPIGRLSLQSSRPFRQTIAFIPSPEKVPFRKKVGRNLQAILGLIIPIIIRLGLKITDFFSPAPVERSAVP